MDTFVSGKMNDDLEEPTSEEDSLSNIFSKETLAALREHLQRGNLNTSEIPIIDSHSNKDYKKSTYWDDRFTDEDSFDWLLKFSQIENFLLPLLDSNPGRILVVGCGNSPFSAQLYDAIDFSEMINIDFSSVIIKKMHDVHYNARPKMKWLHMDMLDLQFESECFDYIIDKATMDALMVDEGDVWYPNEHVVQSAHQMCSEMSRVLKPGGKFIQISFAQPHFRTKYLMDELRQRNNNQDSSAASYGPSTGFCETYQWTSSFQSLEVEAGCLNHYMYIQIKS